VTCATSGIDELSSLGLPPELDRVGGQPPHCVHSFEYESQYQGPISKKISKCWRVAKKLGLDSILVTPELIGRPKGMHEKTYHKLLDEFEEAQYEMHAALGAWLDKRGELRCP